MKYQTTGMQDTLYAEEMSQSPRHHHSRPVPAPQTRTGPAYDIDRPSPIAPSHNEMHFFERVRMAMDNRDVYNEFLKLINLFTQDIIDMRRLVEQSRTFLGEELLVQFKEILGWDSSWESNNTVAGGATSEGMERLSKEYLSIRNGPSYRRLPSSVSYFYSV